MSLARILLVDDDAAVRSSISFALEVEGFAVETFASAEDALQYPELLDCDCFVLDFRLAGMDGLALLQRLRSDQVTAPAIVITSNPPLHLRTKVRDSGAILLEKPLLRNSLKASIQQLIAGGKAP